MHDPSNGYQRIAETFTKIRGVQKDGVGTAAVRAWARKLEKGDAVLDLGCGTGLPLTAVLVEEGLNVSAIDASEAMVKAFKHNFPTLPVECKAAELSDFFEMKYNGILAWGLVFLLKEESQKVLIEKIAKALVPGGRVLFTSPEQRVEWADVLTGEPSLSLGRKTYCELMAGFGLEPEETFGDEGGNYYYSARKKNTG